MFPHLHTCRGVGPVRASSIRSGLFILLSFLIMGSAYADIHLAYAAPLKVIQQQAEIHGSVTDENDNPVPGAEVSLISGNEIVATTRTGPSGEFSLHNPSRTETNLTLSFQAHGFVSRVAPVDPEHSTEIRIALTRTGIAEQVTVTANRIESRLGETAASIVVMSDAELERTAALTLDDKLRQVPGFQLFRRTGSRTANPTSQGVSLRGVGASGTSRALVLFDGVSLNDPFGGWVYWDRVPRELISSVEVVRGGASSLYGSSALGGVIQILPKLPEDHLSMDGELSYGNQATGDGSALVTLGTGRWGATLAGQVFKTDGYIPVDESQRGPVDTPAASRHSVVDLAVSRTFAGTGRVFARGAILGESRRNGTPLQYNRTYVRQLVVGGELQPGAAGSFSFRAFGGTQTLDQTFSSVSADRTSETLTRLQRVPAQSVGFLSQWTRTFGSSHAVAAGLDFREVRGASDEVAYVAGRPTSFIGAGGRERTIGLFAQDIVRIRRRFILTLGGRFDRWRNFDSQSVTRPIRAGAPSTVTIFPDRTESAFSPRGSLLFQASPRFSAYLSGYRAFRQPTLNELYRSFRVGDVLTLANEQLRAERLTGAEAGAIYSGAEGRLNLRGTVFLAYITRPVANTTVSITPALITRIRENLGRTRSNGFELEGEWRAHRFWTISAGYLFVDPRVVRFPENVQLEGLLLPQVARNTVSFQVTYANPSVATIAAQGRFVSVQFDDDLNRFELKPFFVQDLFASRKIGEHFEAFAAVENLFNTRIEAGKTPVTTLGAPRLVRAGLRFRFAAK